MKVVHLSAADGGGGAALAAFRLHQALRKCGQTSSMVVGEKTSGDSYVIAAMSRRRAQLNRRLDRQPGRWLGTGGSSLVSSALVGSGGRDLVVREKPDLVHLHWVCNGFLRIESWKDYHQPMVWSLHDMWMFAGGEHYVGNSVRYREGYTGENRPLGESGWDLDRWIWRRKQRALRELPAMTFLCVSHWLADCARASALLRHQDIRVLHNGIDLSIFRPQPRAEARQRLNLPPEARLVIFGAVNATGDRRKGFDLLLDALIQLRTAGEVMELVVFGDGPDSAVALPQLGFTVHFLGEITDPAVLASAYAACDVAVVPSREEAFGQTAAEAMACGTPVVAFRVGGLPEIVLHEVTGFLAPPSDTAALARGVQWILAERDSPCGSDLRRNARSRAVQDFSAEQQATRCVTVYEEVVERWASRQGAVGRFEIRTLEQGRNAPC